MVLHKTLFLEECFQSTLKPVIKKQSMNFILELLGPLTFSILGIAAFCFPFISAHVSGG